MKSSEKYLRRWPEDFFRELYHVLLSFAVIFDIREHGLNRPLLTGPAEYFSPATFLI